MAKRRAEHPVVPVAVDAGGIVLAMYALDVDRLPKAQRLAVVDWERSGCLGSVYDYLPGGYRCLR